MQNGRFPCKIALRLKKVCYKVSLCENFKRHSCKAFIGLTNRAKRIGGSDSFHMKFWIKVTALERNRRFSIYSLVATQPYHIVKKTSINTNRKFTTRFLERDTRRIIYSFMQPLLSNLWITTKMLVHCNYLWYCIVDLRHC